MTERTLQLTLREWRALMTAPRTVVALTGVGLVLGLSGPFGTYGGMPPGGRIVYWLVITFATFGVGMLASQLVAENTPLRRLGPVPAHALAAIVGGVAVTATVLLVNRLGGIHFAGSWSGVAELYFYCAAISVCVTGLFAAYEVSETRKADKRRAPALLKRLPIELRGTLSHLSMQDHYVEIVTDKGSKLVLLRLTDAIAETEPVPGQQVHRSHWVALDAVARTRREGERHLIEMKDGAVLPISRSSLPAAREAGLVRRVDVS